MQIGIGGQAGDAYDQLRHYLPSAQLRPHDPTTAVELAALVLIKDKGARPGQPVDAFDRPVAAYNGTGLGAQQYADRVLGDASSYGADPLVAGSGACQPIAATPLIAGDQAKLLANGTAEAPANAPASVQNMIAAGNRINQFPYSYGVPTAASRIP